MFPKCKNCPASKCAFIGHTVEIALNACHLLPLFSALKYLDSLTVADRNAIIQDRPRTVADQDAFSVMRSNPWPFRKENKELDREMIARKALYGKDTERLNLN